MKVKNVAIVFVISCMSFQEVMAPPPVQQNSGAIGARPGTVPNLLGQAPEGEKTLQTYLKDGNLIRTTVDNDNIKVTEQNWNVIRTQPNIATEIGNDAMFIQSHIDPYKKNTGLSNARLAVQKATSDLYVLGKGKNEQISKDEMNKAKNEIEMALKNFNTEVQKAIAPQRQSSASAPTLTLPRTTKARENPQVFGNKSAVSAEPLLDVKDGRLSISDWAQKQLYDSKNKEETVKRVYAEVEKFVKENNLNTNDAAVMKEIKALNQSLEGYKRDISPEEGNAEFKKQAGIELVAQKIEKLNTAIQTAKTLQNPSQSNYKSTLRRSSMHNELIINKHVGNPGSTGA